MEKRLFFRDRSNSPITALTYQPVRREVVLGHEDGTLICYELESGKYAATYHYHKGWITDFLYWSEGKVLFSSSVDRLIVQWSSSFIPYHSIELPTGVYSLLWNPRRDQLICGRDAAIGVLNLTDKFAANGLPLLSRKEIIIEGHTGFVKCLAAMGSKVYSAGFDSKLIVHEASSMPGEMPLKPIYINHAAHNAGVNCMLVAKDTDSSTWVVTGSFDERAKIWTADGKPILSIQCNNVVTGICYVPQTRVLWLTAGTVTPIFFEPKLGENISEYVPVLGEDGIKNRRSAIQLLRYFPEISEVIGSTYHKEVVSWRYNSACTICIQQSQSSDHIETITYTNKVPILIFTASYDGQVTKWERLQLNTFVFSTEPLSYREKLTSYLSSDEGEENLLEVVGDSHASSNGSGEGVGRLANIRRALEEKKERAREKVMKADYRGFVKSLFVESLEQLVVSSLDGKIFVWGYDKKAVQAIMKQIPKDAATMSEESIRVTSRVAGFTCLHILNGHTGCVSGLILAETDNHVYLISAGWDLVICLWDLESGSLVSQLKHATTKSPSWTDTIITDLDYCSETSMFAYSTSESTVEVYQLNGGGRMNKVGTLSGHSQEVTQVRWNRFLAKWVTGSEDETVRIWPAECDGEYEMMVSVGGPVSVVTVDKTHGFILVAVENVFKIFNHQLELLQVNQGHKDVVRCLLHIPELDQYISSSWDKTLRIWKSYQPRASQIHSHGDSLTTLEDEQPEM